MLSLAKSAMVAVIVAGVFRKHGSSIVSPQFFDIGDADLSPLDEDQPFFGEFVQDVREVFLCEVEALRR